MLPLLYPLKTPEKRSFSVVSRGYKVGTWATNRLMSPCLLFICAKFCTSKICLRKFVLYFSQTPTLSFQACGHSIITFALRGGRASKCERKTGGRWRLMSVRRFTYIYIFLTDLSWPSKRKSNKEMGRNYKKSTWGKTWCIFCSI